jgi:peptide/nickel transport system substrate-binding protein
MRRRSLIAAALAAPVVARAQKPRVLTYVPYVDLAILDPMLNTASQTRTHAYMVYDTLYGIDAAWRVRPQMVAGHVAEDDFRIWTLTLRDGLAFHDGTPVLARDVVASIRRWGARDEFGETLLEATDALDVVSDKILRFRMKHRFTLLPDALGKIAPTMPAIMPARLAATDPRRAVTEIVGSGPFRFVPGERVPGARAVYERYSGYVPREEAASLTAGGKQALLDRVVWQTMPDQATAAAALQAGEVQWWDTVPPDLVPLLARDRGVTVAVKDTVGVMPVLRFNALQPPFDNAAIRRAVLEAVDQAAFMAAFSSDPAFWRAPVGIFPPGTPMANDEGLAARGRPLAAEAAKRAILEAGYAGAPVVLMNPTDHPVNTVMAQIAADLMRRIGLNVDLVSMDAGTMFQRRGNRGALGKGGWSAFPSMVNAMDLFDPAVSFLARGNGEKAWFGWPTSARMEALREAWLEAADLAERQRICRELQAAVWAEAPYVPLGQIVLPTAYRRDVEGVLEGFPKFWGVARS